MPYTPEIRGIRPVLARIRKALRAAHDPVRALNEKRYLKSTHMFLGVNIPTLRKISKDTAARLGPASRTTVHGLARTLWSSAYHQEKTLAIFLLALYPEYLDKRAMKMLEDMLQESEGWDHVDYISTSLVSIVLDKDPEALSYLSRWKDSKNHWMRRASLISQIPLLRKGRGDRELFFSMAEEMTGDREFFVRKAIGWTIREISKHDPEAARAFLLCIKGKASGLTMREGAKRLPVIMRKEVIGK